MNSTHLYLYNFSLRQFFLSLLIIFSIISCVTINIYFPAAAAEEAAEKIVDEVLNLDQTETTPAPQSFNDDDQIEQAARHADNHPILVNIINFMIPAAHAAQANLSIETSKIRSLRNSMGKRQTQLKPYYASASIGFTNNGLIAIVPGIKLSAKKKSIANKLVKAENNDRNRLYKEIAHANGHPEWHKDIQKTFSQTWINKISSGWMYQTTSGKWRKK